MTPGEEQNSNHALDPHLLGPLDGSMSWPEFDVRHYALMAPSAAGASPVAHVSGRKRTGVLLPSRFHPRIRLPQEQEGFPSPLAPQAVPAIWHQD